MLKYNIVLYSILLNECRSIEDRVVIGQVRLVVWFDNLFVDKRETA